MRSQSDSNRQPALATHGRGTTHASRAEAVVDMRLPSAWDAPTRCDKSDASLADQRSTPLVPDAQPWR